MIGKHQPGRAVARGPDDIVGDLRRFPIGQHRHGGSPDVQADRAPNVEILSLYRPFATDPDHGPFVIDPAPAIKVGLAGVIVRRGRLAIERDQREQHLAIAGNAGEQPRAIGRQRRLLDLGQLRKHLDRQLGGGDGGGNRRTLLRRRRGTDRRKASGQDHELT